MSPETYAKIRAFLDDTLPDGYCYVLAFAPGMLRGEEPKRIESTLITNTSAAGAVEFAEGIVANRQVILAQEAADE